MASVRTPRGIVPIVPLKGRGAASNRAPRFDAWTREVDGEFVDAALDDELPPDPRTSVTEETARTIVSRNQSPDVPFDQSVNPYQGCEHGCSYCYARPTHAYLGLSPGLDFETRLYAKTNAAELLAKELSRPGYVPSSIALGANTDPYQPVERRLEVTRSILRVLAEFNHPVGITTKSALVERDVDILQPMAAKGLVRVFISITTLDHAIARRMEPRASAPARRIEAIRRLSAAGIPVGVLVAPVVPALTDQDLEAVLEAARSAGAGSAGYVLLRLPLEVRDLFVDWLEAHYPLRAKHVMSLVQQMRQGRDNDPAFGRRMRGTGPFAELVRQRFDIACRRLQLNARDLSPVTSLFAVPGPAPGQLALF
jgi:DNA repair photolyase